MGEEGNQNHNRSFIKGSMWKRNKEQSPLGNKSNPILKIENYFQYFPK